MEIILKEDVDKLGLRGEVVKVSAGYGRNYLLPRGLAVEISAGNLHQLEHEKRAIDVKQRKERAAADTQRGRIESVAVTIARKVGEGDVLYGSVTNADIAEALAEQGVAVDKRKVQLDDPIKALGSYKVPVKLLRDVVAEIKVNVVKES
jgi:large subunit ribosomal protein L9